MRPGPKVIKGTAGAVAGLPLLFVGFPSAASAKEPDRVVVDPTTGEEIHITNEGDCGLLQVTTRGSSSAETGVYSSLSYDVLKDCTVVVNKGGLATSREASSSDPAVGSEWSQGSGAPESGGEKGASVSAAAAFVGNWVNTSQTLQDLIFVDISKLRFHTDRRWNQTVTEFSGAWYARSSTSKSWNHPSGLPTLDSMQGGQAATRTAQGSGRFHSDFLWCNFEPGQNFVMTTSITTKKDGAFDRSYSQNRQCAGTHKATESGTSATPPDEWCDIYPNGQGC